jgi:hypothetical protein
MEWRRIQAEQAIARGVARWRVRKTSSFWF